MKRQNTKRKDEKMVLRGFLIKPTMWQQAQEKAGMIPLSRVLRRLIEMWLNDEIDIGQKGGK